MGIQNIDTKLSPEELRAFIKALLNDLRALEKMIADAKIDEDQREAIRQLRSKVPKTALR